MTWHIKVLIIEKYTQIYKKAFKKVNLLKKETKTLQWGIKIKTVWQLNNKANNYGGKSL